MCSRSESWKCIGACLTSSWILNMCLLNWEYALDSDGTSAHLKWEWAKKNQSLANQSGIQASSMMNPELWMRNIVRDGSSGRSTFLGTKCQIHLVALTEDSAPDSRRASVGILDGSIQLINSTAKSGAFSSSHPGLISNSAVRQIQEPGQSIFHLKFTPLNVLFYSQNYNSWNPWIHAISEMLVVKQVRITGVSVTLVLLNLWYLWSRCSQSCQSWNETTKCGLIWSPSVAESVAFVYALRADIASRRKI